MVWVCEWHPESIFEWWISMVLTVHFLFFCVMLYWCISTPGDLSLKSNEANKVADESCFLSHPHYYVVTARANIEAISTRDFCCCCQQPYRSFYANTSSFVWQEEKFFHWLILKSKRSLMRRPTSILLSWRIETRQRHLVEECCFDKWWYSKNRQWLP